MLLIFNVVSIYEFILFLLTSIYHMFQYFFNEVWIKIDLKNDFKTLGCYLKNFECLEFLHKHSSLELKKQIRHIS